MPSQNSRTITIDKDVANDLSEEALVQTRLTGKRVTIRQVAEMAIRDYIQRARQEREQSPSRGSRKKPEPNVQ